MNNENRNNPSQLTKEERAALAAYFLSIGEPFKAIAVFYGLADDFKYDAPREESGS